MLEQLKQKIPGKKPLEWDANSNVGADVQEQELPDFKVDYTFNDVEGDDLG